MLAFLITASASDHDVVVARLWELGTSGIEERPGDRLMLLSYFDDHMTASAVETALADLPGASVAPSPIPDVDWVARFKENFGAFDAAGFWIVPAWDRAAEARANGRPVLVIDPGRAFGTGTHESTTLCLGALERLRAARPLGNVADIGTGSGILAIAARKLGANSVVATDIDPEALISARQHAALNDTPLPLVHADGARPLAASRFDTVLANIMAPVLIERAPELLAISRPSGRLVLAGLLASELDAVRAAYVAAGALAHEIRGEWASLVVDRRGRG
jgi:ribosomal protein L11 methyltransferase